PRGRCLGHSARRRPARLPRDRGRRDRLPRGRAGRRGTDDPASRPRPPAARVRWCPGQGARGRASHGRGGRAPRAACLRGGDRMRVAWLADSFERPGGAELTQAEFRAAVPAGVVVVDVPPDELELLAACDVACVHNCVTYPTETVAALAGKPALRY